MIALPTLGKFQGRPTKKLAAKYGGGSDAGIIKYIDTHKFPKIEIKRMKKRTFWYKYYYK